MLNIAFHCFENVLKRQVWETESRGSIQVLKRYIYRLRGLGEGFCSMERDAHMKYHSDNKYMSTIFILIKLKDLDNGETGIILLVGKDRGHGNV